MPITPSDCESIVSHLSQAIRKLTAGSAISNLEFPQRCKLQAAAWALTTVCDDFKPTGNEMRSSEGGAALIDHAARLLKELEAIEATTVANDAAVNMQAARKIILEAQS